ncbi:Exocyst subunit Exo70 family protein [Heracleum sosnowskyi]|uniref:Exocyst subunit Exo70 family protein n=1 Tax=Heracleum sosnowskyi TaxID=360622 RepID=A0AAD8N4J3_9APIA|nr:Exocyst subunit Exo70 family protein [Heracleum sosnowskyi]
MRNIFSAPKSPSPPHRTTFSSSIMDENMESASSIFLKWNTDSLAQAKSSPLFFGDRTESKVFLKSIQELHFAINYFISENYSSDKLAHAQNLMQMAMKRLEKEFYIILAAQRDFLHSESSVKSSVSSYTDDDVLDDESQFDESLVSDQTIENHFEKAMVDLKRIADCMITYGYEKECAKIYKLVRKSVVDEKLYYLGVENLSFSQIQKLEWETVELKIKQWVNAMKVAIRTLFRGERTLCDHVFAASDTIREACFAEISISGGLMLLSFPEIIAKCKKSPEKIFKLLDLYDAISQNWEDIVSIFNFESTSTIRLQAHSSLSKLGDAIRITLSEFEAAIQKHTSKSLLPGGGVHPLTRYVMNYFVFMVDYSSILPEIIAEDPVTTTASFSMPESYFSTSSPEETPSAISLRFAWIILVLLCKLDGNAQLYKDVSLSYLFLANNLNYIVSKVRNSNLKVLLGDEWLVKHQTKVQQYASNYERMSWSKLMASFPNNPAADISPEEAKKCFLLFNLIFEESYRKQSTWIVTDPNLRDQIKTSVANQVLSVYREFYEKNRQFFRRGVGIESIVRYAPEDLENYLSDLFSGIGGAGESTSSYSSVAASPAREIRRR